MVSDTNTNDVDTKTWSGSVLSYSGDSWDTSESEYEIIFCVIITVTVSAAVFKCGSEI